MQPCLKTASRRTPSCTKTGFFRRCLSRAELLRKHTGKCDSLRFFKTMLSRSAGLPRVLPFWLVTFSPIKNAEFRAAVDGFYFANQCYQCESNRLPPASIENTWPSAGEIFSAVKTISLHRHGNRRKKTKKRVTSRGHSTSAQSAGYHPFQLPVNVFHLQYHLALFCG